MKGQANTKLAIRSSLALALALAIWSPVQAQMMNRGSGGMGGTNGWMGGGMWTWTLIGVLVVVLLVVVINKVSTK